VLDLCIFLYYNFVGFWYYPVISFTNSKMEKIRKIEIEVYSENML